MKIDIWTDKANYLGELCPPDFAVLEISDPSQNRQVGPHNAFQSFVWHQAAQHWMGNRPSSFNRLFYYRAEYV